jgi:hypothetical protein
VLKRAAVRIALECMQKGSPGALVDDDRRCEGRVAPRRCKKARLFRLFLAIGLYGLLPAGRRPASAREGLRTGVLS